jgi:flagellar hook-length control protein FliK
MPVAPTPLNLANTVSAPEAASPSIPGESSVGAPEDAFTQRLEEALAASEPVARSGDSERAQASIDSEAAAQVVDPSAILALMPGLPGAAAGTGADAATALANGEPARFAATGADGAGSSAAMSVAGLSAEDSPGTSVAPATGRGPEPAAAAAMAAEAPAARTAAGGARLPTLAGESDTRRGGPHLSTEPLEGFALAESAGPRAGGAQAGALPAAGVASPVLAGQAPAAPVPATTPVATTAIGVPVGRPEWGSAVGERIGWLAGQRVQVAELQLTPAHLGPIEVRISLERDVATLSLAAAHAPVREALQASLPRLAEALAGSGLQLGQASVGTESFLGGGAQERGGGRGSHEASSPPAAPGRAETPMAAMRLQPLAAALARGGIDLFA